MQLQSSMRRMTKRSIVCLLALLAGASACGPPHGMSPRGVAKVTFTPVPEELAELTLDVAAMRLLGVEVYGAAAPPPSPPARGPGPRPPPPPPPPMPRDATLDALSTGVSLGYANLPRGLYSRLRFVLEDVELRGTWRTTPFEAHLATFRGESVDLRAAMGKELGPGQDVEFTVTVDVERWFAADLLDAAVAAGGTITCDEQNNPMVADKLLDNLTHSFFLQ